MEPRRYRPEEPARPDVPKRPAPLELEPDIEDVRVPESRKTVPIVTVTPARIEPEKPPTFIAEKIADHARMRNKIDGDDAIKPATKSDAPTPIRRQQKPLPTLKGKAGRVHTDDMVDDILRTMLRDGKAPYGKARQQYNYKFHIRLADLADELIREGVALHETFRSKGFWREWSGKTGKPVHASFYRKFA